MLGIFKYASFISENLSYLLNNEKLVLHIALPIGISFFTFQLMSYIFDIYYGNANAQKNPLNLALYITLFPQLIAGPIVRYQQIENEITHREESLTDFSDGFFRFVYGLSKKVLIANFMAQVADSIFDYPNNPSVMTAWLGAIAYTLQIYFDFSGYSDMAIGLGRIFGFHFLENFNYPYIATSVTEFWRRWHISLSTWFRDYVYIPLGGNRVSKGKWIRNLFLVWLLTGIWHGANWTFVLWGMIYFVSLMAEKFLIPLKKKQNKLLHRAKTLLIVTIAWVVFRVDSVSAGVKFIGYLFGFGTCGLVDERFFRSISGTFVVFGIAFLGTTPLISNLFQKLKRNNICWAEAIWIVFLFFISTFEIVSANYNPFIYFNF